MTEGLSLENYNNTVVITADRNGSTAFIESIKRNNYNSTVEINLGECFSQDYGNPSPKFWNEQIYKPPQVIDAINIGTGKRVIVKCLITWKNFNESYFDINTYPYIDSRIANWANCLDGTTYIDQRNLGAAVTANSFSGTTVVSLFDTPALFETAKSESAPKNGAGAVEIVSYNSIPTGYLAHPSSGFFPTTLIRQ